MKTHYKWCLWSPPRKQDLWTISWKLHAKKSNNFPNSRFSLSFSACHSLSHMLSQFHFKGSEGKVVCELTWENAQCFWLIVSCQAQSLFSLYDVASSVVHGSSGSSVFREFSWARAVGDQSKEGWVDLAVHDMRVLWQTSLFCNVAKNRRLCSVWSGRKGMSELSEAGGERIFCQLGRQQKWVRGALVKWRLGVGLCPRLSTLALAIEPPGELLWPWCPGPFSYISTFGVEWAIPANPSRFCF